MKVKVILKSLLFSYAVTGAFLLFLAFLLFQFDFRRLRNAASRINTAFFCYKNKISPQGLW